MWKFARLSKNLKVFARNSFHVCRCLKSGDHQGAASAECEADQDKPRGLSKNTIPKMDLKHWPNGFDLLLPWLCGEPVWYFLLEPPVVVFGFKKQSLPTGICFLLLLPEFNPEKSRVCCRGSEFLSTSCCEWWKLVSITDLISSFWFQYFKKACILINKIENGSISFHLYFHISGEFSPLYPVSQQRDPQGIC